MCHHHHCQYLYIYIHYQVVHERRLMHLHALCFDCLGQTIDPQATTPVERNTRRSVIKCRLCGEPWTLGSTLILGTMYAYDVFAAAPCCVGRRQCRRCGRQPASGLGANSSPGGANSPGGGELSFSDYSQLSSCLGCRLEDYHDVKPFDDVNCLVLQHPSGSTPADVPPSQAPRVQLPSRAGCGVIEGGPGVNVRAIVDMGGMPSITCP